MYEGCPESIRSFWISRKPVACPWCNLASGQREPYCTSVKSHSPVGLVSRQWDAVDWACILCDRRLHESSLFQRRFQLWEKPEGAGGQIVAVGGGGADRPGWCDDLPKKNWAGALSWGSWSARSVIVNETVTQYTSRSHKLIVAPNTTQNTIFARSAFNLHSTKNRCLNKRYIIFKFLLSHWWENRRERDHWRDLGVDGWIMLGRIFRRWDVGI